MYVGGHVPGPTAELRDSLGLLEAGFDGGIHALTACRRSVAQEAERQSRAIDLEQPDLERQRSQGAVLATRARLDAFRRLPVALQDLGQSLPAAAAEAFGYELTQGLADELRRRETEPVDDMLIDEHDVLAAVDDHHGVRNGLERREQGGARAAFGGRIRPGTKPFARVPHSPVAYRSISAARAYPPSTAVSLRAVHMFYTARQHGFRIQRVATNVTWITIAIAAVSSPP